MRRQERVLVSVADWLMMRTCTVLVVTLVMVTHRPRRSLRLSRSNTNTDSLILKMSLSDNSASWTLLQQLVIFEHIKTLEFNICIHSSTSTLDNSMISDDIYLMSYLVLC